VSAESIGNTAFSGVCVPAPGRPGQLRHRGKRFALQFGFKLAFADRLVLVQC
jgi:hypothetical protein